MAKAEAKRNPHFIDKHPVLAGGFTTIVAAGPIARALHHEKPHYGDKVRMAIGLMPVYGPAVDFVERIESSIVGGAHFNLGRREDGSERKFNISGRTLLLGGLAVSGLGLLWREHAAQEKEKLALKEAPEEIAAVRKAYDIEVSRITDSGLTGAQEHARDYATKQLVKDLRKESGKGLDQQVRAADALIQASFDPEAPIELREALITQAGDGYEAFGQKELVETAAFLTAHPAEGIFEPLKELAKRAGEGISSLPFGLGRIGFLGDARKTLDQFSKGKLAQLGNVSLDANMFVGAASPETVEKVRELLADSFGEIFAEEAGRDATVEQIALLNAKLPGGKTQLDAHRKDAVMNQILAARLVQTHPEVAPKIAQLVGVFDALQNNPEVFPEEVRNASPVYRRRSAKK